jgi:hypothetical protein
MYIYPLSRNHNTSLVSAYFGLDQHECGCLEYLFIYCVCVDQEMFKVNIMSTR